MSVKRKKIIMLGEEILPGKGAQLNLNVAKLHTHTSVQVPVIINRAHKDGPVVLLMAGMHGDEINGVEIVRRIIRQGFHKPKTGTIICIPVFNIFGFLNLTRVLPDGRDLNRSFPGALNGSLASQFAYHFMKEIAPNVDYVIDFHTGAAKRNNKAQIRCVFKDEESMALAQIFNPPFIINSSYISKSIREALHKKGKKILLFEGGKSDSIEEEIIQEGIDGVKRLLQHLGMNDFKELSNERLPIVINDHRWMRAPNSGMFQSIVENGAEVKKGEIIGMVTDPFGKIEKKVRATHSGFVFCVNESPVVNKGDAIYHIGKPVVTN
ncbi:succinylglutamate desuccinylase/aspartoacylase family protein [Crocinitomicaceae bacterium]|nr:succinylglutamate desuccinylase/aspartoacylase family protein [Crocinitomicaceae bacterium]